MLQLLVGVHLHAGAHGGSGHAGLDILALGGGGLGLEDSAHEHGVVLEELVGEIRENPADSKTEEPSIRQIDDNTWEITGNIELEAIEKAVGVDFEMQNVNTITGLVFDHLKGIPNDGATNLCLQLGSLSVQIKEIREHQVVHAEIVRNAPAVEKEVC